MKLLNVLLVTLVMFCSSAFANDTPFKIRSAMSEDYFGGVLLDIVVTSLTDDIFVKNVEVNRGGCKEGPSNYRMQNKSLKFGQSVTYQWRLFNGIDKSRYECEVIEVKVYSSAGDFTYYPN